LLNDEFKKIVSLSDQEKKIFGKTLSDTKNILTSEYEKKENELSIKNINKNSEKDIIDISIETDNIQQ
jgi:phenylalanyl-tRNA synthetase alpha subunit